MLSETQKAAIFELRVRPSVSASVEVSERVRFLCDYVSGVSGCRGLVLGISGGQDSSLAGRLGQLACERLRASGRDVQFYALRLPYGEQLDEDDAQLALSFIEPDVTRTIDIRPAVQALEREQPFTDFNRGNVKARLRMVAQYALAGEEGLLVLGTDHAAEAVTGFFTKHGDGACDLVPLAGLTKGQGAALLQYLGAPARLWQKTPTADLLDGMPAQPDEESLGVSYAEIDAYLTAGELSEKARDRIDALYRAGAHKRQLPATFRSPG